MSWLNLRREHVSLIARAQIRFGLRGGSSVVFLVFALLTGLLCAGVYTSLVEQVAKSAVEAGASTSGEAIVDGFVSKYGRSVIEWMVRDEPRSVELTNYLINGPAVVSAFLVTFFMVLPFAVILGSFNQVAGEIGNRGFRYQLPRTERSNIFFGRFIGTAVFASLVFLILMAVVWLYLLLNLDGYRASEVSAYMARGTISALVYALPYIALCSWISTFFGSAFGSMALANGVIGGVPILLLILAQKHEALGYLWYATPWGHKYLLFDPSWGIWALGVLAMLVFTAVFLILGARHFNRRDL